MKRKIAKFFKIILIIMAFLALTAGTFKHLERKFIERATEHLERDEPYAALEAFDSWQTFKVHQLVSQWGLMDPLWYYHYGLAALRVGDYQKAYKLFGRVAEFSREPKLKSLAYFNQGEARLWQWGAGAFEDAASLYIETLKIDENMMPAKKRLEWLRQANLIKTKAEMKAKGDKGQRSKDKSDKNGERGDNNDGEKDNRFKSTQGKQRRGY